MGYCSSDSPSRTFLEYSSFRRMNSLRFCFSLLALPGLLTGGGNEGQAGKCQDDRRRDRSHSHEASHGSSIRSLSSRLASGRLDLRQLVAFAILSAEQGIGLGVGMTFLIDDGLGGRVPEDLPAQLVRDVAKVADSR